MADDNKPSKRGRKKIKIEMLKCVCCNNELNVKEFYNSDSDLYKTVGKIPYCKECLNRIYLDYKKKYEALGYANPDRKAIERICMLVDIYYNDAVFDSAVNQSKNGKLQGVPLLAIYVKNTKMAQYKYYDYDTTIHERYSEEKNKEPIAIFYTDDDEYKNETVKLSSKMFGKGFEDDEYVYLYEQYCDWTSRHECNTKAQEEVFKNICLTQLQLLKATRAKEDTKDLSMQLQRWLDTGKLQPKQNSGEAVSDAQTFGTLIDKWENTRPIPEPDPEWEDVDGIKKYIDVFFRGHLAKTVGIDNDLADEYENYMKEYTVEKPEYQDEDDRNALYDAVFGSVNSEEVV